MAFSITCTSIRRVNGRGYVNWSDSSEMEFDSVSEVDRMIRQYVRSGDAQEFLKVLALAKWRQVNPALDNPSLLIGRTLTIDLDAAANLVRVT